MKKTITNVTITANGLSDSERTVLEHSLVGYARALMAETDERDQQTMEGVAAFERGDFITMEEWGKRLDIKRAERHAKSHI